MDTAVISLSALAERPPVAIAVTLAAYVLAQALQARYPRILILNPTLIAVVLVVAFIEVTGTSYTNYLHGAQIVNFMLAPTVVLLAVPLYRRVELVRRSWPIIAAALLVGLPTGIVSALGIARAFGAKTETFLSLAPKSVTTGIAIGISESIGGIPALTAVFVILTGIIGAIFGPWLLHALRIKDDRVLGLAMGVGSHGIGTARAFEISEVAGAFSSLAMALNGVLTAVLLPIAFTKWG